MSITTRNARTAIRDREVFKTGGALSARYVDSLFPRTGRLSPSYSEGLSVLCRRAYNTSDKGIYVVYSYETPIAWFDPFKGQWVRPEIKYSVTTSRHQGQCPVTGTE